MEAMKKSGGGMPKGGPSLDQLAEMQDMMRKNKKGGKGGFPF